MYVDVRSRYNKMESGIWEEKTFIRFSLAFAEICLSTANLFTIFGAFLFISHGQEEITRVFLDMCDRRLRIFSPELNIFFPRFFVSSLSLFLE